jgi:hypothetical protein
MEKNGFAGFFPMPEERSFRIVASLPDGLENKEDLNIEDVLPDLKTTNCLRFKDRAG